MQSNVWLIAAGWMALALLASLISIRIGVSVALIEILVGVMAGNFLGLHSTPWIDFLATFGSASSRFWPAPRSSPKPCGAIQAGTRHRNRRAFRSFPGRRRPRPLGGALGVPPPRSPA